MAQDTLGLQLSHADRDGIDLMLDSLSNEDVETFNTNDNTSVVIAPVNQKVVMAIEDNADDLDLDHARLKIMAVNTNTMETSPADVIAEQFNQQNGYNDGNDYPLSQVYDLVEFILNEADTSKLTEAQHSTTAANTTTVATSSSAPQPQTTVTSTASKNVPNSSAQQEASTPAQSSVDVPASTAEQSTNGLFDTNPIGQNRTSGDSKPHHEAAPTYDPTSGQLVDPHQSNSSADANQAFENNFDQDSNSAQPQTSSTDFDDNFGQDTTSANNQNANTEFDDNFGADQTAETTPSTTSQGTNQNQGFDDNFGVNTTGNAAANTAPTSSATGLDLSEWDDFGTTSQPTSDVSGSNNQSDTTMAPQNTPAVDPTAAPDASDKLLKRAAELFDNNYHLTLPDMDEETKHELMGEVTATRNDLTKIRNQAIYAIRQRLLDVKNKAENTVRQSDLFESAQKNHDATVKTIQSNLKVDITNTQNDGQQAYTKARNEWVEAQRPQLESKYDSEHLAAHQTVIKTKIESLKKKAQEDTDTENEKFEKYTKDSLHSAVDNYFDHMNIDDILKKANAQGRHALNKLQASSDKYHSNLAKVQAEREELKRRLEQSQQLQEQRVQAQVAAKSLDIKRTYDKSLDETKKQLQKTQQDLEDSKKRNESMQDLVREAKIHNEESVNSTQKMNELMKRLENVNDKQEAKDREAERDRRDSQNQQLIQQALLNQQQHHDLGAGWKGVIVLTLASVLGLGGWSVYNLGHSQDNAPTTVRQETPASSSSSSSFSSDTEDKDAIKPGDTFKYTTDNGDRVTVTADTPHSGHYTDSNGQEKSVIW